MQYDEIVSLTNKVFEGDNNVVRIENYGDFLNVEFKNINKPKSQERIFGLRSTLKVIGGYQVYFLDGHVISVQKIIQRAE